MMSPCLTSRRSSRKYLCRECRKLDWYERSVEVGEETLATVMARATGIGGWFAPNGVGLRIISTGEPVRMDPAML
jgi:hypothetical protein